MTALLVVVYFTYPHRDPSNHAEHWNLRAIQQLLGTIFRKLSGLARRSAETNIERELIADIGLSITYGMRLGLGDDCSTIGGH